MPAQRRGINRRALIGAGVLGVGGYAAWRAYGEQAGGDVAAPPTRHPAWTYDPSGALLDGARPTLADGTLYLTAERPNAVHAVDAGTGRRRWTAEVGAGERAEAALGPVTAARGTAYVAGEGGRVVAFDAADGTRRWATDPLGGGTALAPLVFGSTVCVLLQQKTVASEAVTQHTARKGVLCGLDAADGRVRWRAQGDMVALRDGRDGLLVAETHGGERLAALDPETGRERWSVPRPGSVVLGPGVAYVVQRTGAGRRLTAVDLGNGDELWHAPAPGAGGADSDASGVMLTVADGGRRLYACDAGSGTLWAYDARSGARRWRATVQGPVDGALAQVGSAVCLSSSSGFAAARDMESGSGGGFSGLFGGGSTQGGGYVAALGADDGAQLWRTDRTDDCRHGPVAVGSHDVVVAHGADWWAYDVRTGRPRWRVADGAGQETAPLVGAGMLYGVGGAGVHAVRL